jgi:hypothetical protein
VLSEGFENVKFYRCLTHFSKSVNEKLTKNPIFSSKHKNFEVCFISSLFKSLVFVPENFLKCEFKKLEDLIMCIGNEKLMLFCESFKKTTCTLKTEICI